MRFSCAKRYRLRFAPRRSPIGELLRCGGTGTHYGRRVRARTRPPGRGIPARCRCVRMVCALPASSREGALSHMLAHMRYSRYARGRAPSASLRIGKGRALDRNPRPCALSGRLRMARRARTLARLRRVPSRRGSPGGRLRALRVSARPLSRIGAPPAPVHRSRTGRKGKPTARIPRPCALCRPRRSALLRPPHSPSADRRPLAYRLGYVGGYRCATTSAPRGTWAACAALFPSLCPGCCRLSAGRERRRCGGTEHSCPYPGSWQLRDKGSCAL